MAKYYCPADLEEYQTVRTINDIRELLLNEGITENSCSLFRIKQIGTYLYIKCKRCISFLHYKKEKSRFVLIKANNCHNHARQQLKLKQRISQSLEALPHQTSLSVKRDIITKKLQISKSTFYKIHSELQNQFDFRELKNYFNKHNIIGSYYPVGAEDQPQIIMATTPFIVQTFSNCFDSISFDFTYKVIRGTSSKGGQYRLGLFAGLSNHHKIIPFCMVISDGQQKKTIKWIFMKVFQIFGAKPTSIVTDEQKSISSALKQLQEEGEWDGFHYYDSFHILKNVKKKLKDRSLLTSFSKAIHSKSKVQFQNIINEIINSCNKEDKIIATKFQERSQRYCFAMCSPHFLGTGVSSSICEKLNDLVKSAIPISKPFPAVIKLLINQFNRMTILSKPVFEKFPFEDLFNIPQLTTIRKTVCKKIFGKILLEIGNSTKCQIEKYQQNGVLIWDSSIKGRFYLEKKAEELFQCECSYQQKLGVPCCHLFKVILMDSHPIVNYISSRWLIKQIPTPIQIIRPRKTRKIMGF